MHLPRLASRNGWLTKSQVQRELAIEAMTVKARLYLYENRRYVSPRQLRERYGTANLTVLQDKYPNRFRMSGAALLDSMIYGCCVKRGSGDYVCSG